MGRLEMDRYAGVFLGLSLIFGLAAPVDVEACISDQDRAALDAFFVATGGENWLINDGWLDPELSPCDRFGVIPPFFSGTRLVLPENNLVGFIPESLMGLFLNPLDHWGGAGLDLCWNDLELPPEDSELFEFIQSHHAGGDLALCNARERIPLDATFSGSWYQPARSGEGLSQMLLDNGRTLSYWFTMGQTMDDPQNWILFMADPVEASVRPFEAFQPRNGRFGSGRVRMGKDGPETPPPERFSKDLFLDRVGPERLHFWYSAARRTGFGERPEKSWAELSRPELSPVPPPNLSERFDLVRLTELAGTTCENTHPQQWISGAWYDPTRSGEGFVVEVLPDGHGVVYWFTYRPDDSGLQAWMTGVGDVEELEAVPVPALLPPQAVARIEVENLVQPAGTFFGPKFDREEVERVHWGSLAMEFFDDGTGHVFWDSVFEDFGFGEHPLVRLARPQLANCGDG